MINTFNKYLGVIFILFYISLYAFDVVPFEMTIVFVVATGFAEIIIILKNATIESKVTHHYYKEE